jgi:hypothetical protein
MSIPSDNFSQWSLVGQWILFHSHTAVKYETCVESVSCRNSQSGAEHKYRSRNSPN